MTESVPGRPRRVGRDDHFDVLREGQQPRDLPHRAVVAEHQNGDHVCGEEEKVNWPNSHRAASVEGADAAPSARGMMFRGEKRGRDGEPGDDEEEPDPHPADGEEAAMDAYDGCH